VPAEPFVEITEAAAAFSDFRPFAGALPEIVTQRDDRRVERGEGAANARRNGVAGALPIGAHATAAVVITYVEGGRGPFAVAPLAAADAS
jgi:hypothetical protein